MIGTFRSRKIIDKQTPIIAIGSCFAQYLYKWLQGNGFNVLQHPWGVIYNPLSLSQIVQQSFEPDRWRPDEPYWVIDGVYHDPYRKADNHSGAYPLGPDKETANEAMERYSRQSRRLLEEAKLAVVTLGLTELWQNRKDGKAFFAVPFPQVYDDERHGFHNMDYGEVVQSLRYAIETIRRYNSKIAFLFSVSPIPLSVSFRNHLGPFTATQFSKSVLHAAVLETLNTLEDVYYMPSYEIVRNDPRAFYLPDGRHLKGDAVNLIMNIFNWLYVKPPSS